MHAILLCARMISSYASPMLSPLWTYQCLLCYAPSEKACDAMTARYHTLPSLPCSYAIHLLHSELAHGMVLGWAYGVRGTELCPRVCRQLTVIPLEGND
eukprot:975698-Rhodomonas_salina.1